MKSLKKLFAVLIMAFALLTASAQKIKVVEGSADVLKSESAINIEFTYDNMSVGKYDKEDYVKPKRLSITAKNRGVAINGPKTGLITVKQIRAEIY